MKYTMRCFFLLLILGNPQILLGINIITFFINPFPEPKTITTEKMTNNLTVPGKISTKILKNTYLNTNPTEGIFATYWGYLTVSDSIGQILFPRKTEKSLVKILITEKIIPIMMIGTTVHHWELDPSVPAEIFSIERKQDPQTGLFFWDTQKEELPSNKIIQLDTIVLFAKPQSMYVPIGITLSNDNPQLIVPNIYAKKNSNIFTHALWVLTIKHFFKSLKRMRQKNSNTYYSEQLVT